MAGSSMPRSSARVLAYLRELLPDDPRVQVKPMFGNHSAFVNGTMFAGVFGNDILVRLGPADLDTVIAAGGAPFEPIEGRRMSGYALVPADWHDDPDELRGWLARALAWAETIPPKPEKKPRAKKS